MMLALAMKSLSLIVLAVAAAAAPLAAQSELTGSGCGTGSTVAAPFLGGNNFAGNMFDIAPTHDMTIECLDLNWSVVEQIDVAVWYCPGTVVGNDMNQLGTWQLFATGTAMAAGANLPTNVVLQSGGGVFFNGFTYGIYVQVVNYATAAGSLLYTNDVGPNIYQGTHCTLTTYYGKGDGLTSGTFTYRAWNGVLYTDEAGPALDIAGNCPGPVVLTYANCTPNRPVALRSGPSGVFVKSGSPCAGLTLAISSPTLLRVVTAGPNGAGGLNFNAPAQACGRTVQIVDVASCEASNPVTL